MAPGLAEVRMNWSPLDGDVGQLHAALVEQGLSPNEAEDVAPTLLRLRAWSPAVLDQTAVERLTAQLQDYVSGHASRRAVPVTRAPVINDPGWLWHQFVFLVWIARLQVRVVRPAFWVSSAVVVLLGGLVVLARPESERALLLYLVAPLVGYLSVAMAFRGMGLGLLECELACPPSARQLVVARLTIVLAYTFGLGICLSFASGWDTAAFLSGSWLAPLLAEVGLTLLLSLRIPTERAAAIVYAGWATALGVAWIVGLAPAASTALVNLVLSSVGLVGICAGVYLSPRIIDDRAAFSGLSA
jgi:hypothetical protein